MKYSKLPFSSAAQLAAMVDSYFKEIEGEYHIEEKTVKAGATENITQKVWDREPEPATLTGLALYLGFASRQQFEDHERNGKLAHLIKRARLRVEAVYEKKLHYQPATGAIFALRSMGWGEPVAGNETDPALRSLTVKVIESGPQLAGNEKEVVL